MGRFGELLVIEFRIWSYKKVESQISFRRDNALIRM